MPGYFLSELATDDLATIRHYIAGDSPTAADRVIAGFYRRFTLIGTQPEMGEARPELAAGDMRVLTLGSYAIFYRHHENTVEIARVLHGARDLEDNF
jgi:toxin ParE1/3/4